MRSRSPSSGRRCSNYATTLRAENCRLARALRDDAQDGKLQIGARTASPEEIKEDLQRRLAHLKLSEATQQAKHDMLANREASLLAARQKLEKVLHARRELEAQVENLHARLRVFQSSAVASTVDLDDTQVAKCQELVDELRIRLRVSERLVSTSGNVDELAVAFTPSDEDVFAQIDEHLRPSAAKQSSLTR
jgi:acetylornithine deacetylase/succinyl-diaminopimelate desuccinylase-like protein